MRLPVIVYAYGDTPTVLHVDCTLDQAAFNDPELVRSNLAETLSTPGILKAGLVVVEVPDDAVLPFLTGGPRVDVRLRPSVSVGQWKADQRMELQLPPGEGLPACLRAACERLPGPARRRDTHRPRGHEHLQLLPDVRLE
ncbi:hypothetical protein [Kutzneria sp. 744]|uniref:hypothetical protein n=1 Tax=Kutzneria sp. (strain 744) TaxID=345341 RepID=UPI0004B3B598|nr:hypothetical protein [Kutzneria sp. 744]